MRSRPSQPIRRLFSKRILFGALLAVVLLLTVLGASVWLMVRQAPTWWRTIDPNDPQTQQLAQDIERGVSSMLSQRRPDEEPWAFRITAGQADAWLNVRLPRWLRNQDEPIEWPPTLSQLQVHFDDDIVHLGLIQQLSGEGQILTAAIDPTLREGLLWCPVTTMGAGQLRLPAATLLAKLERSALEQAGDPEGVRDFFAVLRGERGVEPILELDDGRLVRLIDLHMERGVLVGTCVTHWAE